MVKTYLSGIQATGIPHIGNYVGAISQWVGKQDEPGNAFYMIADLHAITVPTDPETLRSNRLGSMAGFLACGLDPKRVSLFFQSDIPAHTELSWLLGSQAYLGELQRMTQFKSKGKGLGDSINLDLFAYPVLQAADILLYQANEVPVGEDQVQHIELTRNIAQRINKKYGKIFTVPKPVVPTIGARLMNLQDPASKMSKSGNNSDLGIIYLTDTNDQISKKLRRAVTDSEGFVQDDNHQPGVLNLLTIIAALSGEDMASVTRKLSGKNYGYLKKYATEVLISTVEPIRQEIDIYLNDPKQVEAKIKSSMQAAASIAAETVQNTRNAFGFGLL